MGFMIVVVVDVVVIVVVVVIIIIVNDSSSSSPSHQLSVVTASRIAWNFISMPSVRLCDLMVIHMDSHMLR